MVTAVQSSKVTRQALVCSVFVRQTPDETYVVILMVVRPYQGARWYDASTGRFNRLDPFFGNLQDPQSLHKYTYVHGDPIHGIDPSGLFSLGSINISMAIRSGLQAIGSAVYTHGFFAAKTALWAGIYYSANVLFHQKIRPIPAAILSEGKRYALLAAAVYGNDFDAQVVQAGWTSVELLQGNNRPKGYQAEIFANNATGEVVLAFAGTNDGPDWPANIMQGLGMNTAQYEQAIADGEYAMNRYGQNIRFVGHSLGGGLASATALVYNRRATTFNAAGVHPNTVSRHGASLAGANNLIRAFRVQGDILSTLQNASPNSILSMVYAGLGPAGLAGLLIGALGAGMPDGVGENYWLSATSLGPVSRHLMPDVFDGLEKA